MRGRPSNPNDAAERVAVALEHIAKSLNESLRESNGGITLEELVGKLDELDQDDYFGTEGWKKFLGFSD